MSTIARWFARVPLAAVAMGSLAGVLSAELGAKWPWAVAPALIGAACLLARRWRIASGLAAWALLWIVHGPRLDRQMTAEDWAIRSGRAQVQVEGVVLRLRDRGGLLPRALFRIDDSPRNPEALRGAVAGIHNLPDPIKPGDRLLLAGRLTVPAGARNPGEFDRLDWMRTRGIAAEMRADNHAVVALPRLSMAPVRFAWDLRLELRERVVAGLDPERAAASVIRGLVLGDRSTGGEELFSAFRESGTMHVFAVSGLHVGLVGLLGWLVVTQLRVPRTWGLWAVLAIMWAYAFVTGLRPPALRASFMASVLLVGFAVKRRPSLANSLLASLPPVLLLDSFQLRQAGFQLTYAVVAAIILIGPLLYRRLRGVIEGDPFLPRDLYTRWQSRALTTRQKVFGLLAVSVAAWLGSVPLIWAHFGMVTPVAVLASMILVPWVFCILSLALLGVVAGLVFQPLEVAANRLNGALADGAHVAARLFSALPGSHFELRVRGGWPQGILVFDLWNGDGAVFCGAGEGVLIDGGGSDEFFRVLRPALREAGRVPRSLVLTHPDGGHAGGLASAVEEGGVRQVLLPVREAASPSFRRLLARAAELGCEVHFGAAGDCYALGEGAELQVLRAAPRGAGGRADDRGMVLRLHWHGWRILFTGDAGFQTEQELLARGIDLASDVWIMGRHESDHTASVEFVKAVAPQVVVVADEVYPRSQRLPEWWTAAVDAVGIDVWSQCRTGAVMIEVREDHLKLRSFLAPRRTRVLRK